MLFALIGRDKPDNVAHRLANRADHLEHIKSLGDQVVLGGPMLNEAGEPVGSLIVVEAGSLADAEAIAARDPYSMQGVYDTCEVIAWTWLVGNPDGRGR